MKNRKELLGAKFQDMSNKVPVIIDGNLAFEKLYAKYSKIKGITLPEREYRDVFALIDLARGIGCEWHNGYK